MYALPRVRASLSENDTMTAAESFRDPDGAVFAPVLARVSEGMIQRIQSRSTEISDKRRVRKVVANAS